MVLRPEPELVIAGRIGNDLGALEQGRERGDAVDWRGAERHLFELRQDLEQAGRCEGIGAGGCHQLRRGGRNRKRRGVVAGDRRGRALRRADRPDRSYLGRGQATLTRRHHHAGLSRHDQPVARFADRRVEGSGNAPAYRGTAYIVFDNLALEKFGLRPGSWSRRAQWSRGCRPPSRRRAERLRRSAAAPPPPMAAS